MNSDLNGKRLLVLGGTQISCEIIEKAKLMGINVIVTDYNTAENSPGKQIVDEHYLVSATDVDAVVSLIKEKSIDGVIVGFNDMLLPYYAEICQRAGFPSYGTKEQFELFINKDRYKALCRKHNVPTVEEYSIKVDASDNELDKIKFPVLVKPADNSGSRGVFICDRKEELKEKLNKALSFTKSGEVLVEQYLTGEEVTVFFVFKDGEYYLTGIGNRHVKRIQENLLPLPVGYTYPASVTKSYIENILPNVKNMLSDAGIQNGMMFMQCKVENGVVVVYDIGFRLTASLEYRMFETACGYNPLEMMIRFALTGKMVKNDEPLRINSHIGKYGYNLSFLAEPGKIEAINGIEEVQSMDGVAGVIVSHLPGEIISENILGLLAQITVRVIGVADTIEDLWEKVDKIQNTIKILSEEQENMVHRKLERVDFESCLEKFERE